MIKVRGNASNTTGFFVNSRGRKPAETTKHSMTKSSGGRRGLKPVKAEVHVGAYKR